MPARSRARLAAAAATPLALLPRLAAACPVCFAADQGRRAAYLLTAGALTLLPLALIAAGALLLSRFARGDDAARHRDAP